MTVRFQKKQKYFIVEYKETKRSIVCEKWKNYPRECAMPILLFFTLILPNPKPKNSVWRYFKILTSNINLCILGNFKLLHSCFCATNLKALSYFQLWYSSFLLSIRLGFFSVSHITLLARELREPKGYSTPYDITLNNKTGGSWIGSGWASI